MSLGVRLLLVTLSVAVLVVAVRASTAHSPVSAKREPGNRRAWSEAQAAGRNDCGWRNRVVAVGLYSLMLAALWLFMAAVLDNWTWLSSGQGM